MKEYILKKYNVKEDKIVKLPISRWTGFIDLLKELKLEKGVEIGTYKGKYAEVLRKAIPDLIVVDKWEVYPGYKDFEENDLETEAFRQATERAKKNDFKIIKEWSLDAVKQFEDESLDFIFIDGNHTFISCANDVNEWSKKVKKGGIVAGHDFFKNRRKEFGVKEAITGWCEAYDLKPLFVVAKDKCPSWFYIKE